MQFLDCLLQIIARYQLPFHFSEEFDNAAVIAATGNRLHMIKYFDDESSFDWHGQEKKPHPACAEQGIELSPHVVHQILWLSRKRFIARINAARARS